MEKHGTVVPGYTDIRIERQFHQVPIFFHINISAYTDYSFGYTDIFLSWYAVETFYIFLAKNFSIVTLERASNFLNNSFFSLLVWHFLVKLLVSLYSSMVFKLFAVFVQNEFFDPCGQLLVTKNAVKPVRNATLRAKGFSGYTDTPDITTISSDPEGVGISGDHCTALALVERSRVTLQPWTSFNTKSDSTRK